MITDDAAYQRLVLMVCSKFSNFGDPRRIRHAVTSVLTPQRYAAIRCGKYWPSAKDAIDRVLDEIKEVLLAPFGERLQAIASASDICKWVDPIVAEPSDQRAMAMLDLFDRRMVREGRQRGFTDAEIEEVRVSVRGYVECLRAGEDDD